MNTTQQNRIPAAAMSRRIAWSYLLIATLVITSAALACGCSKESDSGDDENAQVVAEVTVTKVTQATIQQTASISGNVIAPPNKDVKLSALVAGRITTLDVSEGDRVHAGELLAAIDSHTYEQQLLQAQAALRQAEATTQNAQQNLKRNQTLYQRGIVAGKDLDDSKTQLSVAQAAQAAAQAAEETASLQVERTKLVSPLNGIVAKRYVSIGEQVDGTGAQPIIEVANISEVELPGSLSAIYLSKIHVGEAVPITSDAFPGKTFNGKVIAISPTVDPATNVGSVRIRIANPSGILKLGMYLNAKVPVQTDANALTVPPQSIYHDESGATQVYEIKGDTATAVPVKLGIQSSDSVEILSGVKAGDTVILTGGYGLGDTAKIKVKS